MNFDPYHKWLGIPPEEQPPNYYRLLGVRVFESDPDVISNAADQRMSHLRSFQTGPYSALSQQLLNEIASVRLCLLNAAKKRDYDARLRMDSNPSTEHDSMVFETFVAADLTPPVTRPRESRASFIAVALGAAACLIAVASVVAVLKNRNAAEDSRADGTTPKAAVADVRPLESSGNAKQPNPEARTSGKPKASVPEAKAVAMAAPTPPPISTPVEQKEASGAKDVQKDAAPLNKKMSDADATEMVSKKAELPSVAKSGERVQPEEEKLAEPVPKNLAKLYLADLKPTIRVVGSNADNAETMKGIQIRGATPPHGLWAGLPGSNTSSVLSFQIPKNYRSLNGAAGIASKNHDCPQRGSSVTPLVFRIEGDGKPLWKSRPLQRFDDMEPFSVPVEGVSSLSLFVDCPGSFDWAWGLWVDPVLVKEREEASSEGEKKPATKIPPSRLLWLLKRKLHGRVSYDAKTDLLTLYYDFRAKRQLDDFDMQGNQPTLNSGVLFLSPAQKVRHVVSFKTVTITGVLANKGKGTYLTTSGGIKVTRDGNWIGISNASQGERVHAAGGNEVNQFAVEILPTSLRLRLGQGVVGKEVQNPLVGRIELCGGESGAGFSMLTLKGVVDQDWAGEFLGIASPSEKPEQEVR